MLATVDEEGAFPRWEELHASRQSRPLLGFIYRHVIVGSTKAHSNRG